MKVTLIGGPHHGTSVDVPADQRIVKYLGARYERPRAKYWKVVPGTEYRQTEFVLMNSLSYSKKAVYDNAEDPDEQSEEHGQACIQPAQRYTGNDA